jgi:hypothetical protein
MEPGKPLGFLDHRIVRGNALIGATPELLDAGVPDDAFKPLTGDDKTVVASLKRHNREARSGQSSLFGGDTGVMLAPLAARAGEVDAIDDDTVVAVQTKATRWSELIASPQYQAAVHAADTWCAAFVAPKNRASPDITHAEYHLAKTRPERVDESVRRTVAEMTDRYGFMHWHLAFLDVFGGRGGFDVVLGNPPWEKVKLSEKEYFAARAPEIASLAGAKRKSAIVKLQAEDADLWHAYESALRQAEGESHFIRSSGRFPLCGRGDVNTYAVFAEVMRDATAPTGRVGVILPTGIATDDTTKHFFSDCVAGRRLDSLYSFENEEHVFEGVHNAFRFCLLTLRGSDGGAATAEFAFFLRQAGQLADPERRFTLSPEDLTLINPNTRTAPVFRTRRDAEITKAMYRRVAVLVRDDDPAGNPWGIEYQRMFDMTNDSHLFRSADELAAQGAVLGGNVWRRSEQRWLPLYEGKMAHHYDHRFGDYAISDPTDRSGRLAQVPDRLLVDPNYAVQPRYWVDASEVASALTVGGCRWLLGFRDITGAEKMRTMIASVLPVAAVGNKLPLLNPVSPVAWALGSVLSSFACDFAARQKIGGTSMNLFIAKQLAVLAPSNLEAANAWSDGTVADWLRPRVLELTYSSWDLAGFAADLGYGGAPFRWDLSRRMLLRAEVDAAFFHLYGLERDDVDYIMDTFPIVRRKDETAHGEYRTKRFILERYDALAEAIATGTEYQTVLDPPPADLRAAHPESSRPSWA